MMVSFTVIYIYLVYFTCNGDIVLEGLMDWLVNGMSNPLTFLLTFFVYCVLAAIILPIPVEIGLAGYVKFSSLFGLSPFWSFTILAVVMGLGKAVGSSCVFMIGVRVEDNVRQWTRWGWFQKLLEKSTILVEKFGYIGLFVIMSIPIMTDTVPLYIFSLLNKEGKIFEMKWFVLANFFAGATRAFIVGIATVSVLYAFW
jgi:membrane protein YqaA with SNARE-associated domain